MTKKKVRTKDQIVTRFEDYIRKDDVQAEILKLRKKLGIPEKGILFRDVDEEYLQNQENYFNIYIPKELLPLLGKTTKTQNRKMKELVILNLPPVLSNKKYSDHVDSMYRLYVVFNQTISYVPKNLKSDPYLKLVNLKEKMDLNKYKVPSSMYSNSKNLKNQSDDSKEAGLEYVHNLISNDAETHPLVLFINPEVSQEAITHFISDHAPWIKSHRPKKVKEVRKKPRLKAYDLMYKLEKEGVHRNEIRTRVNRKFSADYSHLDISSVLNKIKKKRK